MAGWIRFFSQWQKDAKLWLFCMSFFLLFRIVFLLSFRDQTAAESTLATVLSAILNGMRFDSVISTFVVLIPFCFSAVCGFTDIGRVTDRVRLATGIVFLFLSTFVCIVTIEYFGEFGDQFNHFLFGLIYDDLRATMLTILKAYHVPRYALVFVLVITAGSYLLRQIIREPLLLPEKIARLTSSGTVRTLFTLAILLLMVLGARGSIGAMPVRERHAGITADEFLNKTVLNPYTALRYAVRQQMRISRTQGIRTYLPDQDIAGAARFLFATEERHADLDLYMRRTAQGPKGKPPRHIFYIVAESYSAWPLWDRFESLHIADGLKGLAREGISITPFIAASQGTMASLNSIVTGLSDADIKTNYRPSARMPYPTSLPRIFRDMGYRVRLFYGGYLTWQRVGDFCRDQGFEEIYGGGHMGKWVTANEWGVDDEHIFSFVMDTVTDARPSINLILTTSFHPPFTVDLASKGFPEKALPSSVDGMELDKEDILFLGHFWYADRCIERFARSVMETLPGSLVVVTADHPGRRWLSTNPDPLEKYLIPCVLYGPEVLQGIGPPQEAAGSHLDIIPTMVELCAPKGFSYHAMGRDLLRSSPRNLAVGRNLALAPSVLLDLHAGPRPVPLPGADTSVSLDTIRQMQRQHNAVHGIAWWRIMKGPGITP